MNKLIFNSPYTYPNNHSQEVTFDLQLIQSLIGAETHISKEYSFKIMNDSNNACVVCVSTPVFVMEGRMEYAGKQR